MRRKWGQNTVFANIKKILRTGSIFTLMFNTSFQIILFSLLSMIAGSMLIYFDTAKIVAFILLGIGFFGAGIGILIGFFKMVSDSEK